MGIVYLRPWQWGDAAALVSAGHSAPDLVTQFGGAVPEDLDTAKEAIRTSLALSEKNWNLAIVVDGVVSGNVGLSQIEYRHETAWAHYWLAAGARGAGLATRALCAISAHAFGEGLFRLELGHRINNPASCAVASRAGFIPEGVERAKLKYGTERFDVELHARLATDPAPDIEALSISGI